MIKVNDYPIDSALEERLTFEAEATKNPVEKGAAVTDHITARLPVLEFEGIVSDTPIGAIATDPTRTSAQQEHSREAYKRFKELFEAADVCVVECSYGKFENMALTGLTPVKNAQTKKSFRFTARFEQIKITENKRTTIRTSIQNGGKVKNLGLSLDKLVEGNRVLWRKGNPPGLSPATDPKGVIVGQEIVHVLKGHIYHEDRKTQLTTAELEAFTKDLNRDSALMQRRKLAVIDDRLNKVDERIKKAQAMLDYKEKHPGAQVDPAMFGL